jgi:hypothetical protein
VPLIAKYGVNMKKLIAAAIILALPVLAFSATAEEEKANKESAERFKEKIHQIQEHPKHNPTKDQDVERGYREHQENYNNRNPKQPEPVGGIRG